MNEFNNMNLLGKKLIVEWSTKMNNENQNQLTST